MKKKQNPIQKHTFTLATVNRSLKLLVLVLIGLVSGVVDSEAQTPAIVGRVIMYSPGSPTNHYPQNRKIINLSQNQYESLMNMRNNNWETVQMLDGAWVAYKNNDITFWNSLYRDVTPLSRLLVTNNGLVVRCAEFQTAPTERYATSKIYDTITPTSSQNTILYIDLNELSVNRAMAAAPMGSLQVTPSNNPSEQTKVQWNVQ
jgi:hypothetical protein